MKQVISVILLINLIAVIGCSDDETGGNTPGFDRKAMLEDLADNVIIPAYDTLNKEVITLDEAVNAFVATPDLSNLNAARNAFQVAYHAWQRSSFWEFGPAFDVLLMSSVNSFPADYISIDNNIVTGSYDFNTISGQDEKGFPAVGYLLYGISDTDQGIVDMFTVDGDASNRKDYLKAVALDIRTRVSEVATGWSAAGGDYKSVFINNDGTDVGSSVGLMVNELNKFVERETRDGKIGIPLGKRSQGIPIPAEVEAGYSDLSISLASENLKALYNFYMGIGVSGDKVSFYDYLTTINAQYNGGLLSDAIKLQFERAMKEVGEIPSPYKETVEVNPTPAEEAYTELQKLVVMLKADMPSALGVLITYQDNDGD
ncbi:imelysin family protein [Fulvivirga sp. 29W222]|uniref:Imelysin family protein n=1 Tax=Fulvivirga marina TaxID=2494733 RepID=A0A937G2U8_9BACT|nr:imelysin family protein [Fulvivirga marina]MBL6449226.1 imelysin family protein [Fulvivirga marina]